MNRIKVIVPVCTDIWNAPVAALMERYKEPDTQIDIVNLDAGPESLEFAYDKACAELPTVKQAETAQREGFAGVIIYCFADPGLAAAKEALSIPVVGLCESSIHMASLRGERFTVLLAGSKERFASKRIVVMNRLKGCEFDHKCASIRPLGVPVLDLEAKHDQKLAQLLTQAGTAIEQNGADTIVLGCGGILQTEKISSQLDVPLIVPALAALKTCESLIRMNLSQSKRCNPLPEKKKRLSCTGTEDVQREI